MPEIRLEHVNKNWNKFYAVDDLNLVIKDNAFVTLLGPSGCGKTTTLRMIAGLETPTSGRITIGDRVVFDSEQGINIPANKRKVGFLFQNYALWPNMTVYQNISFGLSNVKEEMPTVDFEAKNNAKIASVLSRPQDVVAILEECKDKKGKTDAKRALLKVIDTFMVSKYTAEKILAYDFSKKDFSAEIKELKAKVEAAKEQNGLNEKFEYTQNGSVVKSVRKLTSEEIDLSVRRVSRIVKIGMFMDRYPAELSGGQQQRVAIARTLAPEPTVLFMDEPLSNLDAKLRLEMRYELQRLHIETGSTFVYVTHDQMEAMTLATSICLINNGVLQQYDAPLTVYGSPNNLFVADFVGNPSINFIEGKGRQVSDGSVELDIFEDTKVRFIPNNSINLDKWFEQRDSDAASAAAELKEKASKKGYVEKENKDETFKYHISKVNEEDDSLKDEPVLTNEDFVIGVRPEFISISDKGKLNGEVYGAMPTGMESTIKIRVGEFLLTSVVFGKTLFKLGSNVKIDFEGDDILLFDRKSGKCIAIGSIKC
ncbi:MAG: ABC transporter ATP-binding protein [Sphaerochaetaceae bacterium]|nr:ABC transporter ATP-binding protein [Sphaerochaetaceae bacterium]